jgi:hypothetical protein
MTTAADQARAELEQILRDVTVTLSSLDLSAPDVAARLESAHPMQSPGMKRVRAICVEGVRDGWLVPREAGPACRFGRLAKDLDGYAVDCVLMSGKALGHTHPRGEVNIAFAWEGEDPRFDGHPAGWVVFPPGSHHVPTVTGGTMLFVYLLPGGDVLWDKPAS